MLFNKNKQVIFTTPVLDVPYFQSCLMKNVLVVNVYLHCSEMYIKKKNTFISTQKLLSLAE